MNIVILSPGYPAEMAEFTRGLARAGARVIGIGEHSVGALPDNARDHLAHYIQVRSLADQDNVCQELTYLAQHVLGLPRSY